MCMFIVVAIARQPENTTVCRAGGSEVIISCGHTTTFLVLMDQILLHCVGQLIKH